MGSKVRIGVLGAANIAQRSVLPAIQALESKFVLTGIASRNTKKAIEFSKKFNCKAYDSYQDLIDSKNLDAVYIPLPNALHYEWVKYALVKGKHVLVEKSLACTLPEVVELNSIARKNKLVLLENFQFRFHPQLQVIKHMLQSGEIGEIRQILSRFGFPPFEDGKNIRYQKSLGGGALLDAGAYPIKVTQEILGSRVKVSASNLYYNDKLGVDLWGSVQLEKEDSAITSHISFGFDQYYQCSLEIWGNNGLIRANRIFTAPPGYTAQIELYKNNNCTTINVEPSNHFENMLDYFSSLINDNSGCEKEYKDNINQARLIENVLKVHHEK